MSRLAAPVALVACIVLCAGVVGCGRGRHATDPRRSEQVCAAVEIAQRRILEPAGTTFAELVRDRRWSERDRSAVAAIRLTSAGVDAGRYQPLIDHLAERHRREVDEEGRRDPPVASPSVQALADRLDGELADGACG